MGLSPAKHALQQAGFDGFGKAQRHVFA